MSSKERVLWEEMLERSFSPEQWFVWDDLKEISRSATSALNHKSEHGPSQKKQQYEQEKAASKRSKALWARLRRPMPVQAEDEPQ